jgi:hypothetical protein
MCEKQDSLYMYTLSHSHVWGIAPESLMYGKYEFLALSVSNIAKIYYNYLLLLKTSHSRYHSQMLKTITSYTI